MKSVGKLLRIPQCGCLGKCFSDALNILLFTSQFFAVLVIETVGVELPSNGAWFLILFTLSIYISDMNYLIILNRFLQVKCARQAEYACDKLLP